jgi:hypothetical protein
MFFAVFSWNHYGDGLLLAGFLGFSLKQSAFQRTMIFQIGLMSLRSLRVAGLCP